MSAVAPDRVTAMGSMRPPPDARTALLATYRVSAGSYVFVVG
ncbi:hypothetical protein ABZ915_34310 [Streptomyces sp. NPDC046915]